MYDNYQIGANFSSKNLNAPPQPNIFTTITTYSLLTNALTLSAQTLVKRNVGIQVCTYQLDGLTTRIPSLIKAN